VKSFAFHPKKTLSTDINQEKWVEYCLWEVWHVASQAKLQCACVKHVQAARIQLHHELCTP